MDANVFQLGIRCCAGILTGLWQSWMICSFCRSGRKVFSPFLPCPLWITTGRPRYAGPGVADATARKELGYGGSYRFTKALEQCGRLSRPALEGSLEILADADAGMKQSAADGRTVLESPFCG